MTAFRSDSVTEKSAASVRKGGQYLLAQKDSNGLIGNDLNVFCKVPLALHAADFETEAREQLQAIRRVAFPDCRINPLYLLRKNDWHFACCYYAWMALAAAELGDLTTSRDFANRMLDFQDAAFGGFYSVAEPKEKRIMHVVHTSICGVVCIRLGEWQRAQRAASFILRLLRQQPNPARLYYRMHTNGDLVMDYPVDRTRKRQRYAVLGKALWFLSELHRATGDIAYRNPAEEIFRFGISCQSDFYHRLSSVMFAWGSAACYNATRDDSEKAVAERITLNIARTQRDDGSWANRLILNELDSPFSLDDFIRALKHTKSFVLDRTAEATIAIRGVAEELSAK
jgi:hypothetical protein